MKNPIKIGDHVTVDGETWEVMTIGKKDHRNDTRYTHLASINRTRKLDTGVMVRAQIARWL